MIYFYFDMIVIFLLLESSRTFTIYISCTTSKRNSYIYTLIDRYFSRTPHQTKFNRSTDSPVDNEIKLCSSQRRFQNLKVKTLTNSGESRLVEQWFKSNLSSNNVAATPKCGVCNVERNTCGTCANMIFRAGRGAAVRPTILNSGVCANA